MRAVLVEPALHRRQLRHSVAWPSPDAVRFARDPNQHRLDPEQPARTYVCREWTNLKRTYCMRRIVALTLIGLSLAGPSFAHGMSEADKIRAYKVVSRLFCYGGGWCHINIVVTDMDDAEYVTLVKH